MHIQVVYALADEQDVIEVEVPEGASARDAVDASGIAGRRALDLRLAPLGRFGRRIPPTTRLEDGDRIEILRPLAMSPMEARRLRARRRARPAGR